MLLRIVYRRVVSIPNRSATNMISDDVPHCPPHDWRACSDRGYRCEYCGLWRLKL